MHIRKPFTPPCHSSRTARRARLRASTPYSSPFNRRRPGASYEFHTDKWAAPYSQCKLLLKTKAPMHCSIIVDGPMDNKKSQPEGGGAKVGASLCPQGASIFGPNAWRESLANVFVD